MSKKAWMHPRTIKPVRAYVRVTQHDVSVVPSHLHQYPKVVDTSLLGSEHPGIDAEDVKNITVKLNNDTFLHFFKFDGDYYGMLIRKQKTGQLSVSDPEKLSDIERFKADKNFIYLKFKVGRNYVIPTKGFDDLPVKKTDSVIDTLQSINTYMKRMVLKRLS